jgi:outer membrane protein, multidrug efflux system
MTTHTGPLAPYTPRLRPQTWALSLAAVLAFSGCAAQRPPVPAEVGAPVAAWLAPVVPHQGDTQALTDWWARWQDPTLVAWIARAQALSPTLADARAQVAQARAQRLAQDTLTGPQVFAVGNASRAVPAGAPAGTGASNTLSLGLQASWALDVWGDGRAAVSQAAAQQAGAQAGWHAARVLVAAEVAHSSFAWHACHRLLNTARDDLASREASARALDQGQRVGLVAPATAALAKASVAQGREALARQRQQCDTQTKALVVLTGLPEAEVRAAADGPQADASVPWPALPAVPATALRQRPDVWQAQFALVAAADSVGIAQAQLLPSLSLSANWLRHDVRAGADFTTWSIGPLAVSVPLVGRDALRARADAAQVGFEAAQVAYEATLRRAVGEVEQALVAQAALHERQRASALAADSLREVLSATEQRFKAGLASLGELEDARRQWLSAQSALVGVRLAQLDTAVTLYVALGGGFDPAQAQDLNRELPR